MVKDDFKNSAQSVGASVKEKETKISIISQKLERLLNTYLDQDIEKEIYRVEKAKLILQKKSLEEEMTSLSHKHNDWLEPASWRKNSARRRRRRSKFVREIRRESLGRASRAKPDARAGKK